MQACKFFGSKHFSGKWFPKFTVIVAQKNHHTRFFLPKPDERNRNEVTYVNVQPGNLHLSYFVSSFHFLQSKRAHFLCLCTYFNTIFLACLCVGTVVDKGICHPRNYDFYMCAHAGMIVCYLYLELDCNSLCFNMFI